LKGGVASASVYSRAVRKAAELVGGRGELARILQAPQADVEKWILGDKKPPRELFLRVVDLLIEDSAGSDSPGEPPAGRDAAGEAHAALFD
jgi:hypothetical protein